ncbi:lipopolysaccharide biosynthesis protein [Bradyrhizobium sp. KBS0727]|uniref:GumC family protein n=1 Tax=unclassified Bradyrhizobium TaxID=2631580 RepID=UPI00110D5104|nr:MULTISPECIES: exopolysaccharide transport family protein [unclassified Bradyrhizobium]QDW38458.1 lipopolysaccharide biosynthesis protein [Bradyrhizobium sp. KBS0725]QDW45061.1 lipopolysaccharide biosynthesis protein [Bradyrhizobium sp. KBS0727]
MRLAFWRAGKDETVVQRVVSKPAPAVSNPVAASETGDLDLHVLGHALARKRGWIIVPTVLAAILSIAAVNLITPRYKSEARILVDGRENVFLRPNGERSEERTSLDAEAVTSQVQLLQSRDLAREIIRKNKLAERPEFDPVLQGFSPLKSVLALFGIGRDPFALSPEERVLDAYYERFTAYAVDKSRVIVVEFQSRDPELAARVANSIAEGYLALQQNARQEQAKSAGQWLSGEIENLRKKVAEAESRVEDFRSKSSLFVGTNNTTLSNQQMGEINTQLNNARALKSDAESKARLIKNMLQSGKPIEASEVLNSELIRRLSEQRVTLRAQLAEQSSTLLDQHPRIKELKAQLADLDKQLRDEAGKVSRSLENDSLIADGRVNGLINSLDQLKKQASSNNGQDVQLRAFEREAKAQRDLLESYLAKYREATTRENIEAAPADGRIISRATVSNIPAYPKKLPIVLIATLAILLLTSGAIVTGELLRMTAPRASAAFAAWPASIRAPSIVPASPVESSEIPPPMSIVPRADVPRTDAVAASGEIAQLADDLAGNAGTARKLTLLGTAPGESITLTALTLARLMSRQAKIAVVDLAGAMPTVAAASADPAAPGLAELMQGQASFTQIITKDRLSRVHLVSAGRPGFDRAQLQSPRLTLTIDALLRVYDHVLLDVGAGSDLPAELLTSQAHAVVVPDPAMAADARAAMCDQYRAVGFAAVTMLSGPYQPADASEPGPHVVAA